MEEDLEASRRAGKLFSDPDVADGVLLRPKKQLTSDAVNDVDPISIPQQVRQSIAAVRHVIVRQFTEDGALRNATATGCLSYIILKVLFWDILISAGDTITDFWQGTALLLTPGKEIYGIITLAINWLPGFVAAIHLVSMYRRRWEWHVTLLYSVLLILFYPVVPVIAYINLLWKKPKDLDVVDSEFQEAEYIAMMAHAIGGGIESPIQFIFQLWLIFNGAIQMKWSQISVFTFTDWQGNTIYLPITASVSLIFSMLRILKSAVEFNIFRVHIQDINSWAKSVDFSVLLFDFLPFLATAAYFRISSIIITMTYLNTFGFVAIVAYLITNIIIGIRNFANNLDHIPLWVTTFISLFFPICFTTKDICMANASMSEKCHELQYNTFWHQSLCSVIVYIPCLISVLIIINLPYGYTNFKYNQDIILDNIEFNVVVGIIIVMGFIALLLSRKPKMSEFLIWTKIFKKENQVPRKNRMNDVKSQDEIISMHSFSTHTGFFQ